MKPLRVLVSHINDEGCDHKTFRLELPEGEPFNFRPGQFILVGFPGEEKKRAFSIGSSPLSPGALEITVAKGPDLSARLFKLVGGEALETEGPQGKFVFDDEDRSAVLISEGVGITPFRSMIHYVLDKGLPNRLHLFYAERRPSCLLFAHDLDHFAKQGVTVHTTVEQAPPEEAWDGPIGPLQFKDVKRQVKDYKSATYYICGRNKIVDAVVAPLKKAQVPEAQIKAEKWGDW